jgi:hypothetical protein
MIKGGGWFVPGGEDHPIVWKVLFCALEVFPER